MKKRTGKIVCIGIAGLLSLLILPLQVLQAETVTEDQQSAFTALSQEVEPAMDVPEPEGPGENAPAFETLAAETSDDSVPEETVETAAEAATEAEGSGGTEIPEEEEYVSASQIDRMAGGPAVNSVSIGEDGYGAYITYSCEGATTLELWLTDNAGNQVGSTCVLSPTGSVSNKNYFLELDDNIFGLSNDIFGNAVHFHAKASNGSDADEKPAAGSVTVTPPSLTMPGRINYSVLSTAKDLYDVNVVSGISWTNGSCKTKRIVEKQNGDSWVTVDDNSVLTSSDIGTYRIRIQTCFEKQGVYFYSNSFRVAAPVDSITVENPRIGALLTAVPKGPDGSVVDVEECSWYLGEETTVRGTGLTYTPVLQELLEAQTLSLRVSVKDYIGNTYTQYVDLAPLDLSTASLSLGDYKHPQYNGKDQIPEELHVMIGDYEIRSSLYTAEPSSEKNSKNAGDAWMTVTGEGTFLTGTAILPYVIDPAVPDVKKEDFITQFGHDGKTHMPVQKDDAAITGTLAYEKWEKQNKDGTWSAITDAPAEPGTYRVNVTLTPGDKNYTKAVLEKLVFTIQDKTPEEPVTEPATEPVTEPPETTELEEGKPILSLPDTTKEQNQTPYPKETEKPEEPKPPVTKIAARPKSEPDLTVTDITGNPMSYTVSVVIRRDDEGKETGRTCCIAADPEKRADGSIVTDETGQAVYRQRVLKLSPLLIGRTKNEGCDAIRFMLGDAGVQISLDAFREGSVYTLALAPLDDTELTENEKAADEGLNRTGKFYAMRLNGSDEDLRKVKEAGITVYYRKAESVPEQARLLFLEEERNVPGSIPVMLDDSSVPVTENGVIYMTAQAGVSGIFSLVI